MLRDWQGRVSTAREQLESKKSDQAGRLMIQMTGALDQLTDAVARMPMETGELYAEDQHRLEQAVAALQRLMEEWSRLS
jgi:hypothetical protein